MAVSHGRKMDVTARAQHQVVDLFHSFSLRGNLSLTTVELEMALSLVDGLEVTRREVSTRLVLPTSSSVHPKRRNSRKPEPSPVWKTSGETRRKQSSRLFLLRTLIRTPASTWPCCTFDGYVNRTHVEVALLLCRSQSATLWSQIRCRNNEA